MKGLPVTISREEIQGVATTLTIKDYLHIVFLLDNMGDNMLILLSPEETVREK